MHSIKLSYRYRLYSFSGYQSMRSAMPYMQRVVLAKGLTDVQESDARIYVQRVTGMGYKNYLEPLNSQFACDSAISSLITALQVLYKSNGYSARYIVIERA